MRRHLGGALAGPVRRLAVLALLTTGAAITFAASAQAHETHVKTDSFGPFPYMVSLAFDQQGGYLYVLSSGPEYGMPGMLEKFDAAGNPVSFTALGSPAGTTNVLDGSSNGHGDPDVVPANQLNNYDGANQLAVDNSGGPGQGVLYFYSAPDGVVYAFAPSGEYLGLIDASTAVPYTGGGPCGVGVAADGAVYISRYSHVDRYVPSGAAAKDSDFVGQFRNPNPVGCKLAGGTGGTAVYLGSAGYPGSIRPYTADQFNAVENPPTTPFGSTVLDLAVDQVTGKIYGLEADEGPFGGRQVAVFDSSGSVLQRFGAEGVVAGNAGIAVRSSNEYVYVPIPNHEVGIFKPAVAPDVTTAPASGVDRDRASFGGHVGLDGAGDIQSCKFEYGPTATYGSTLPCSQAVPIAAAADVSGEVEGLSPESGYHYRLVATNSTARSVGQDRAFTTPPPVLGLKTEDPEGITTGSAILTGSFTGDSHATTYYFEWGTTKAYGQTTTTDPGDQPGATTGNTVVTAALEGLEIFTPYHYRVVASNEFGTSYGADQVFFTTPPPNPLVLDTSAEEVRPTSATLHARINPNQGSTVFRFDYGLSTSYERHTPVSGSIGSDASDHPVSAEIDELHPGTTYHYRVIAINVGGTTHGPDRTFVTPDRPKIDGTSSSAVGQTSATLTARLVPNSSPTSFHFEYGPDESYGTSTAEAASIGADTEVHEISTPVVGLSAGRTYHYRVVATNLVGTTYGPDQVLTTAPPTPQVTPQAVPHCRKNRVLRKGKCVKRHHRSSRRSHKGGKNK